MKTAAKLTSMTEQVDMTRATKKWFDELYLAGAVKYSPDAPVLDPKVRAAIQKMHHELAAGNPAIFERLEKHFEDAWRQFEQATTNRQGPVFPFTP